MRFANKGSYVVRGLGLLRVLPGDPRGGLHVLGGDCLGPTPVEKKRAKVGDCPGLTKPWEKTRAERCTFGAGVGIGTGVANGTTWTLDLRWSKSELRGVDAK